MTALPEWMRPPRPEGWFAEDLDRLTEAPRSVDQFGVPPTGSYAPAGIYRRELRRPVPFEISLDLDKLVPSRKG